MSDVQVAGQLLAPYVDVLKALVRGPRTLLRNISGERSEWRLSLHLAVAAVLINALLHALIKQDVGQGARALVYFALMVPFYTLVLHLFADWLLQTPLPWLTTSTAVNYAVVTTAVIAIPYVAPLANAYFFVLIFLAIQELYGAARDRALITIALFILSALVFVAAAARMGLVNA